MSYQLYVLEGEYAAETRSVYVRGRRDLGVVASLKEAEAMVVGSAINCDEIDVFARQLPDGPLWSFRVNKVDSTFDWWLVL